MEERFSFYAAKEVLDLSTGILVDRSQMTRLTYGTVFSSKSGIAETAVAISSITDANSICTRA